MWYRREHTLNVFRCLAESRNNRIALVAHSPCLPASWIYEVKRCRWLQVEAKPFDTKLLANHCAVIYDVNLSHDTDAAGLVRRLYQGLG